MRVDLFGVREGGEIDGKLIAPLRPEVPTLKPGKKYLLETVIRTLKMGHLFTQGTADSNEVWLDVTVTSGDRVIGRSGATRSRARQRGRSVGPLRQRVHARQGRQPHRPPQPAGHLHAAVQPPDSARRRPDGSLRAAAARRARRAGHRRGEAAIPQVRPAVHGLRRRRAMQKLGRDAIRGHAPGAAVSTTSCRSRRWPSTA